MTTPEAVRACLSRTPTPAHYIAHKLGDSPEAVYAELVKLYDRRAARIAIHIGDGQRNKVAGWVVA